MKKYIGFTLILFFLVIHLILLPDYGFTWDFHFHFFGGGKLLGISPQQLEPRNLPFVEPDPRRASSLPYGPLMSIPPVASYLFFYKTHDLLPPDVAYHIPIILWGVAGIGILYTFLKEAYNPRVALLGALFLALTPRFFGDTHNNMKDVPSAVIFSLNMWLLWRLVTYKRLSDLLFAVLAFAAAFNVKINSIFIPIVFAAWLIMNHIGKALGEISRNYKATGDKTFARLRIARGGMLFRRIVTALAPIRLWKKNDLDLDDARTTASRPQRSGVICYYFLLAPLAAFALWSLFWPDPIGQLKLAYSTFGIGTNNIEVLLNGTWYCSGSTVPWYYPWWYLGITTPLPILVFFVLGVFTAIRGIFNFQFSIFNENFKFRNENSKRNLGAMVLLILWLILPLTRYLIPSVGVIDGIRHFEEVLFPLAALAALGADKIINFVRRPLLKLIFLLFTIYHLLFTIYSFHPYQITYFNELVGGVKGAFGKYDLDYWGTSQKTAVQWVNENAPPNAKVHIIMAAAVAGQYLRPDLIPNLNKFGYDQSDFVILLNRTSFLYRFFYAYEYFLHHKPAKIIDVQGAPLVWIYDNRTENRTPRQAPFWQDEDPCILKYWRGEKLR